MAPITHFQTPNTAKPLTRIERNQLREPQAMSGYHLGTTWGPKKLELFIKVSAWAKRLYIEPFFQFVHFCLLACLPQQKVKGYSRSSVQCTQQKVKGYTSSCCTLRPLGSIQQELCTQQKVKGYTAAGTKTTLKSFFNIHLLLLYLVIHRWHH